MAQKKKKGPPPKSKEPKKQKITGTQIAVGIFGLLMVIIMILQAVRLGQ